MAGLLNPQQAQQLPPEAEQLPPEGMEQEGPEADENDPAFQAAIQFLKKALYETGAADQINQAIKRAKEPVDAIANYAYELVAVADEKTQGAVPDELLVLLASTALEEVCDIAEASGIKLQPADVASALKMIILRFVGEQGHDTRALHEAMNQISPEQINQMAMEGEANG